MVQAIANDTAASDASIQDAAGGNKLERKGKRAANTNAREQVKDKGQSQHHKAPAKKAAKVQPAETKASIVLKKLQSGKGATIDALMSATGWQAHSVRGFLSAIVKKRLGLKLVSDTGKDRVRRYRIEGDEKAG